MNLISSNVTESPVGIETPIAEEDDTNEEEPLEHKHSEHALGNTTDTSEITAMNHIEIDKEDLDTQDATDSVTTEDRNEEGNIFVEDEIDKTVETNDISELIEVKHERIEQSDYSENLSKEEDIVEKVLPKFISRIDYKLYNCILRLGVRTPL